MKAHKPNTDQECNFTVSVNGSACHEYVLPKRDLADPNTLECFIPTWPGDRLTVNGHFNGTALHGAIDLLADGSFLADKRIEGKGGEATDIKVSTAHSTSWSSLLTEDGIASVQISKGARQSDPSRPYEYLSAEEDCGGRLASQGACIRAEG